MSIWKALLPTQEALTRLTRVAPGKFFVDTQNDPGCGTVYLRDLDGQWLSLSWDYVDVEFKFEIYCLAIEVPRNRAVDKLTPAGVIPDFDSIVFLTKSDWVRPALSGEVPAHFEQVIEQSGRLASVPESALAIGTTLYGVVFMDATRNPRFAIAVDEQESYSVRGFNEPEGIKELMDSADAFSLDQLIAWKPPAQPDHAYE